jgi:hypothetical protein
VQGFLLQYSKKGQLPIYGGWPFLLQQQAETVIFLLHQCEGMTVIFI